MKQEVEKWRPFGHPDGDIRDLSFLDAERRQPDEHQEMINHEYHHPDVQKVATFPLPGSFSFLKKVTQE